jgi:drug/metabolite transporter (DMT)-like permease
MTLANSCATSKRLKPNSFMQKLWVNRNFIGCMAIFFGVLVFSTQDAIVKSLSGTHAVSLAIVMRSLVSIPVLLSFVAFEGGLTSLRTKYGWFLIVRGLILLSAYTFYYLAFPALPFAEAITLYFVAPLLVTILSGLLLREEILPLSWFAILLGLVGVVIILQPGGALFEPAALLSLFSAVTYALCMVMTRKYGAQIPASVTVFYTNAVYLIAASAFALYVSTLPTMDYGHPSLNFLLRPWVWPSTYDLFLLGACGVIASVGMVLLTHGYRTGDANLVTVFEYTGMVWAAIWGYLFFAEVPRSTTFTGMAFIATAGLISLWASVKKPSSSSPYPTP